MKTIKQLFESVLKRVYGHVKYQLFFTYMLVGIITLTTLGGVLLYVFTRDLTEKNFLYVEQLNNQILLNLESNLSDIQQDSFFINYDRDLYSIIKATSQNTALFNSDYVASYRNIDNYFFNMLQRRRQIWGYSIYTLDGEVLYSISRYPERLVDKQVNNEPWFIEAVEQRGRPITRGRHEIKYSGGGSKSVISIVRAMVGFEDNTIFGVIVVDEDIEYIAKIIENIKIGDSKGIVIIADSHGALVYSNSDKEYAKVSSYEGYKQNVLLNTNISYTLGTGNDRVHMIQSISEQTGWKVITCIDHNELVKDSALARNIIITFMLICLAITYVISAFVSSQATKPLIHMKELMLEVEKGDFNVQVPVHGHNEISSLEKGFNSMITKIRQLIQKEYQEKLLRNEAELNLLQAQINPHFLYNTLGSIKSMARSENASITAKMIQTLSRIFRYSLGSMGITVSIREEIEYIKDYLLLQQYRFQDKISASYDLDESALDEQILVMCLQPIVENAIIHGLMQKNGNGHIHIVLQHDNDYTKLLIIDDGIGMDDDVMNKINAELQNADSQNLNLGLYVKNNKIGMLNVNYRIKYKFGKQYGLIIRKNDGAGITVEISLPRNSGEVGSI